MLSKTFIRHPIVVALCCAGLVACAGSDKQSTNDDTTDIANAIPVITLTSHLTAVAGDTVMITVQVTDDDEPTISWSQQSGEAVTLLGANTNTVSFTAPNVATNREVVLQVTIDDGVNSPVTSTVTVAITPIATSTPNYNVWLINSEDKRSNYIFDGGEGVLYDVQLVEQRQANIAGTEQAFTYVEATGIPEYNITMTQEQIDALNSRPRANTDFLLGYSTANVGDVIEFGQDIGYNSSTENCNDTGGAGYWPPGPVCPTNQGYKAYFTEAPEPKSADEECNTALNTVGLMVNGTAIFGWGDGHSYGQGVWYYLAPISEQYDVDICGGHAAMGDYHHHFYTSCLADLVGDKGDAHSPIYGYAADGYPVYGPWESAGELAVSGWNTRNYGADTSAGGCGTPGERSCILNDPTDLSQGVKVVENGPNIGAEVTTLSGNKLAATDGYFYEDYYYAGREAKGAQLDEHNGHDNNDGLGYHYHITLTQDASGKLTPAYPFTVGPTYAGKLPSNAIAQCTTDVAPPPPPHKLGRGPRMRVNAKKPF
jgi:hypothetical protein